MKVCFTDNYPWISIWTRHVLQCLQIAASKIWWLKSEMSIIFLAWEILFTGIAKKMVYFFLNVRCALFLRKYRKLFVYAGAKVFSTTRLMQEKNLLGFQFLNKKMKVWSSKIMHLLIIVVSFGNDCQQNYTLDFLRESQGPHVSTSRRSF